MASAKGSMKTSGRSAGSGHAGRLLALFAALVVVTFALVFFTGDKSVSPKLGIDLQGGTRVTLTPRTPDGKTPSKDSLKQAQDIIATRVNGLGVAGPEVLIDGNNLVITVPGDDGAQVRALAATAKLYIRPVNQGPAPSASKSTASPPPSSSSNLTGSDQIAKEIQAAKAARQSTDPKVQQQTLASMDCSKPDPLQGNDDPKLPLIACDTSGGKAVVYLLDPSLIDGQEISNAASEFNSQQAQYSVSLDFKSAAAERWAQFTGANVGKLAAFVLDSKVVSAPRINGRIDGGRTEITGQGFNAANTKELANTLKYGSLPLSFGQSEAQTVSATLGSASLNAGILAGVVGLVAVLLYCLLYYRMLGVLITWSLVCSGVMVFGLLVLLGRWIDFTLDLSGIAGLIIGIGMTADSFVVYFERIKDEIREGRSFRSAVPRGWARARRTILSGNAVSFIAAAVLYILAIGEVRGFAFTLGLTTILDTVIVFLVTAPLVTLASRSAFWAKPSVNGLGAVQQIARERRAAAGAPARAGRA